MDRAAEALLESIRTVFAGAGSPSGLPVVLGGGVLGAYRPLRDAVWHGTEALGLVPCTARPPAVGAVALAIRALTDEPLPARARAVLLSQQI
jgi:hypothetical protein